MVYIEFFCWLVKRVWEIINFFVLKCFVYGKEKGLILVGNGNVMFLNGNKNWELYSCKFVIIYLGERKE